MSMLVVSQATPLAFRAASENVIVPTSAGGAGSRLLRCGEGASPEAAAAACPHPRFDAAAWHAEECSLSGS